MLLTITYRGEPATDLGYLLYKHPARPQTFELSHGKAHVFYTEATDACCTVAMLLDINPVDLARGKRDARGGTGGLFDYVNDRPYVASSFLSVALSRVFGTAMSGTSKERPELAAKPLPLEARIVMLPCHGAEGVVERLFQPLGYDVHVEKYVLDEKFPEWGESRYNTVTLKGEVRLCDLLNHLYVLIPVLDSDKHYWVGKDEIDKLLSHGEGWLANHPERGFIASRYLGRRKSLVDQAVERLTEEMPEEVPEETSEENIDNTQGPKPEKKPKLNQQRMSAVVKALKDAGAESVIDIGCGEGVLLSALLKEHSFRRIAGADVCYSVLERAKDKLKLDRMTQLQRQRITLFQGSLTYRDKRFSGYDAAAVIEVIEHLDENRLTAFERVLFRYARPKTIVLTTPNIEYNRNYNNLLEGSMRHRDHRFEWTRSQFRAWAERVAGHYGYAVSFSDIGDLDEQYGSPTQMAVFALETSEIIEEAE